MTEHVTEYDKIWGWRKSDNSYTDITEEYETLKAATERLSAGDARRGANRIDICGPSDLDVMVRLRAYADILDGRG